jgi:hypothetical protein
MPGFFIRIPAERLTLSAAIAAGQLAGRRAG